MTNAIPNKYAPMTTRFGTLSGFGEGDGIGFDSLGTDLRDNYFVFVHNGQAYYMIEWENRINSHP